MNKNIKRIRKSTDSKLYNTYRVIWKFESGKSISRTFNTKAEAEKCREEFIKCYRGKI